MKNTIIDKELEQFVSDIKRDLLFHVIVNMREKKTTVGLSKYLAKDFLELPVQTKQDVLDNLYVLSATYPEARTVFAKYIGPFEEEKTQTKLYYIRLYMKEGNYDKALEAAKGVNEYGRNNRI